MAKPAAGERIPVAPCCAALQGSVLTAKKLAGGSYFSVNLSAHDDIVLLCAICWGRHHRGRLLPLEGADMDVGHIVFVF